MGGAGSAVAQAAIKLGVERLTVIDTEPARAREVAAAVVERFGAGRAEADTDLRAALATADGVINTRDNLQFRNRFNKALQWTV